MGCEAGVSTVRRCGVHAGGCGAALPRLVLKRGPPPPPQEGDADLTEKLRSTREIGNVAASLASGNAARAQTQVPWPSLSPHPAGAGAAGLQPRHMAAVPRPSRSPSALGALHGTTSLGAAAPAPKARASSTFTVHVSRGPDTARHGTEHGTEHGTQGGAGQGGEQQV